jgi:hypothetical protein
MDAEEFNLEQDPVLDRAVREFRRSGSAAAEKPEEFWLRQRRAVMEKLEIPAKHFRFKPAIAWSVALAAVLIVFGLWIESPEALPAPDFAGGYDQDLLYDVERLTTAEVPDAFQPAYILVDEIRSAEESKEVNK